MPVADPMPAAGSTIAPDDRGLRRLSGGLALASLLLAVLLPLAVAWSWFATEPAVLAARAERD